MLRDNGTAGREGRLAQGQRYGGEEGTPCSGTTVRGECGPVGGGVMMCVRWRKAREARLANVVACVELKERCEASGMIVS